MRGRGGGERAGGGQGGGGCYDGVHGGRVGYVEVLHGGLAQHQLHNRTDSVTRLLADVEMVDQMLPPNSGQNYYCKVCIVLFIL